MDKFKRSERNSNSNEEKLALGELVAKFEDKFDAEVKKNEGKTKFDVKRKIHVAIKPSTGFTAKAVQHFYSDLAKASNDDLDFERAAKLASRCYNDLERLQDPSSCLPKKSRRTGVGRKVKAQEVTVPLFNWFVDVRESLEKTFALVIV